jgi:alpha-ketoglutarate-dependent taurine dioxygenase
MHFTVKQLSPIGAEIHVENLEGLLNDDDAASQILDLLEKNGVLVFPQFNLDDVQQAAFCRHLGETVRKDQKGWSKEYPDVFTIAMDEGRKAGAYMKGSLAWHFDGPTSDVLPKATILTGRVIPDPVEGHTEFTSTYAAYDRLSNEEKERFEGLKVWHSLEVSLHRSEPNPTPQDIARAQAEPPKLHPLVWTHLSGRKSLVIGQTAATIEGMDEEEGAALLLELVERAARPEYVYSHTWSVGDMVIWDNRGVIHRAMPYGEDSGREMHRCTLVGDEAIK